jgi:hypothetical protein
VAEERCGDGAEEVRTVTLCHPAGGGGSVRLS